MASGRYDEDGFLRLPEDRGVPISRYAITLLRGMAGAAIGGAIGFFLFRWMLSQGLYAIILPGVLLGMGCGLLAGRQWIVNGVLCGVAGLILGLYSEWRVTGTQEFGAFVAAVPSYPRGRLLLIALGAILAAWFGRGRDLPYNILDKDE